MQALEPGNKIERAPRAIVVGAGPAGLMAAEALAEAGARVTIFDQAPSPARKFLLAGRGGLNLTHSEPLEQLITRYGAAAGRLRPAIEAFPPAALRAWCEALGEPTFVGSSGRIFPKSFKSAPLLRAWLRRPGALGVELRARHRLTGFGEVGELIFEGPTGETRARAEVAVLACGGASWPRLGSDGAWTRTLRGAGIGIAPLRPANSGFDVAWSAHFIERFAGAPIKPLALRFQGRVARGEAVVTARGIEGGAIYALSATLREAILSAGAAELELDLKPDWSLEQLTQKLARPAGGQSLATFLRKNSGLSPAAIGLLRECGAPRGDPAALAHAIKRARLRLTGVAPIERAISTAGGIAWEEIDDDFMLRRMPGLFVAGEMIDWEAPTGGYLLQACFSIGVAAGRGAARWLGRREA